MKRAKRVLHATDFSGASGRAFATALDLARADHAELLLVHVLAPVVPIRFASTAPSARNPERTSGDARRSPVTRTPPETT